MANGESGYVVFRKLVDERRSHDKIKKRIQLAPQGVAGPRRAPKNRTHLHVGNERAAAVGQLRSSRRAHDFADKVMPRSHDLSHVPPLLVIRITSSRNVQARTAALPQHYRVPRLERSASMVSPGCRRFGVLKLAGQIA